MAAGLMLLPDMKAAKGRRSAHVSKRLEWVERRDIKRKVEVDT